MKPVVAIVGRPNVGKSTLFNRITRSRDAIVENYPGITRDRHYGDANWNDVEFTLVDTGGFVSENTEEFTEQIRFQIDRAIADADAVVVLFDGKHGVSPFDKEIAELLRKTKLPVFYVVNKIDGHKSEVNLYEFYSIGINKLYPVSAEHKYGIGDFLDELVSIFPQITQPEPVDMIKLSVTGRPNVGKSSLINRILGQERLIVSDIPGTTRDAVHSVCKVNGQSYMLIDTAGIRRKGRVTKKVEKFSVIKALKSLELCDIALIMIDASEGITAQDTSVAGYAVERGCGCVFLLNKWDAVQKENKDVKIYYEEIKRFAKFLPHLRHLQNLHAYVRNLC